MDTMKKILELPLAEWKEAISALTSDQRMELTTEAANTMIALGRLHGYLEGRYMYEERPHDFGVQASNKMATKIRQALGYSYPKQDITF